MPYFSELSYLGSAAGDFAEVVLPAGTDPSAYTVTVYNPSGTVRSTNGLGTKVATISGQDVYVISTGIHKNGAVALDDGSSVLSFVSFDRAVTASGGAANGLTSTQIGTVSNSNQSLASTDGISYTVQLDDPGVIPCFLAGTRIETDRGAVPVEVLKAGDQVLTAKGDLARLAWVGMFRPGHRMAEAPVCIPQDSLGPGLPNRDLTISPNHQIAFGGPEVELFFGAEDVFVAAKFLIGHNGIGYAPTRRPTYHHLLFDRHEVIIANGVMTESFQPGRVVMDALDQQIRSEILTALPELHHDITIFGPSALPVLREYEAQALTSVLPGPGMAIAA